MAVKIHIIHTGGTIGSVIGMPSRSAITEITPSADAVSALADNYYKTFQGGVNKDESRSKLANNSCDHRGSGTIDMTEFQGISANNFGGREGSGGRDLVEFRESRPLNVLSENLTPAHWETLIAHLKTIPFSDYSGLILTHGTDTLAYTSCLLSLLLDNIHIPVILVSANKPLSMAGTNGFANFNAAVRMIALGLRPGVYAVYRNQNGKMYLHAGTDLLQCQALSQDFFSLSYCGDAGFPLWEVPEFGYTGSHDEIAVPDANYTGSHDETAVPDANYVGGGKIAPPDANNADGGDDSEVPDTNCIGIGGNSEVPDTNCIGSGGNSKVPDTNYIGSGGNSDNLGSNVSKESVWHLPASLSISSTKAHETGGTEQKSLLHAFIGKFAKIIAIQPYVGLDYSNINLSDAAAVIHGLYHSRTAAVNVSPADDSYSMLYLNERCKENGIPLCIAPFGSGNPDSKTAGSLYETTAQLLSAGVIPIYANTFEFAYIKLLIEMSL